MTRPLACLSLLLALAAVAAADSWRAFADQRVVSPSGRYYVVVRGADGGAVYEVVRRRDGAPPIEPVARDDEKRDVARDPEDAVVFEGKLRQKPLTIRCVDDPPAVVFFECYGNVGYGDSLTIVTADAKPIRLTLEQIVGPAAAKRYRQENASVSSVWWYAGFLVDGGKRRVLVVTTDHELRLVSFDGQVTTPATEVLLRHFRIGTAEERALALDTAADMKPEGLGPEALALARDEAESTGLRLRAAVAAKRAGADADLDSLFLRAVEKGNPVGVRSYATAHLGEMLGTAAMPVLRRLMRGPADEVWAPAQRAFASLGEAAVPTLLEMLAEEGESPDYRGGAAHALKEIGSAAALDGLLEATATAPEYVANAAVNAVIAIGASDLGERLAKILAVGSTQDSRIASYFREHPAAYAREPLEAALARAEKGSYDEQTIREALEAQPAK